ncbi:MAG: hypothetical protein Q8N18_07020 [Opitutaceae bacterium]|nr:hypothetical protein [Opitutaceae bacterium]
MKLAATLFLFVAFCLAGCQTVRPSKIAPYAPLPIAKPPAPASVRIPEVVKTYALGAYADPEDASVRHAAHVIHRVEGTAAWNLSPDLGESSRPSATAQPLPPAPPPAIVAPPEVVPASVSAVASPPAAIAAVAVPETPPPLAPTVDLTPVVMPNADGLIDLTALDAANASDEINPFAVRTTGGNAPRELTVVISGVVSGNKPTALVNKRPVEIGEHVESLTLERVETDAALFRSGGRLLRLPISTQPVRIRLAL